MAGEAFAVIDLGDDFAPRTGQRSRRSSRGGDHTFRLFAVLLAVFLAVAGGGTGAPSGFVRIAHVRAATSDSYQLFDNGLYVWEDRQPQTEISRYELNGHLVWRRLVAGNGPQTFILQGDNETIVNANLVDGASHVMGLDRRTGAVLWDQAASYGTGYPLIEMADPRGRLLIYETGSRGSRLRWVDTRTGRDVWRVDLAAGWDPDFQSTATAGGRQWLVSVSGQIMGVRLDDRGERVRRALPDLGRAQTLDFRTVIAGHGLLVVTDVNGAFAEDQHTTLHAYDQTTLTHKWDARTGRNVNVSFCGGQICETSNRGVSVLDPATGRRLWGTTSRLVYPTGSNLIVGPYPPADLGRQTIVRAGTGRRIADITSWSFVQVGQSSWSFIDAGRSSLLLTRPTHGFLGVWVAWLHPGDTRPAILGAIPGMSTRCVATPRHVACHAIDGTIMLWRTN